MKPRTPIPASFISKEISNGCTDFTGYDITENLNLSGSNPIMHLTFNNCSFQDHVRLRFLTLPEGIYFEDCDFTQDLNLVNINLGRNSTHAKIVVQNCKLKNLTFDHITSATIDIVGCDIENASLTDSDVPSVSYRDGAAQSVIFYNTKSQNLFLNAVSISKQLRISSSQIDKATISSIKAGGFVQMHQVRTQSLAFADCLLDRIELTDVTGKITLARNEVSVRSTIFYSKVGEQRQNTGTLILKGNTFKNTLRVSGPNSKFDRISINCNDNLSGQLHFDSCEIESMRIIGTNTDGDLLFIQLRISVLEFYDFTNLKSVTFSGCTTETSTGELIIVRTDLGKTKFLNHRFDYYKGVRVEHSFISEILTVSCHWFHDNQLEVGDREYVNARREVYRQLKQASEKQGDRIQALLFQAEELKAFESEIKMTTRWYSADRLILSLSKTNLFGLHWGRALGWLMAWTIAFFIPMAIFASPEFSGSLARSCDDLWWSIKVIVWNRLPIFMQLFNPAHNPLAYVEKNTSPIYFLLDGVHRIGAAFLIVQIVSAFRKFIRS